MPAFALISLATIGVSWSRVNSSTYPYSLSQPSSYRHIVFRDTSDHDVDYYFPSLGSTITNLNVYARPGCGLPNQVAYFRSIGGQHPHRSGWITVSDHRLPLMKADFSVLAGRWTVERITFPNQGLVWYVTASYDVRYRSVRPTLLRMMRSFRPAHRAGGPWCRR
jgi:hypothetical protein